MIGGGRWEHVSDAVWGGISAAVIGCVVLVGFPLLIRGGRRRGRAARGGGRVRVGPGAPVMLAAALLRHLDTILLIVSSAAIVVLIVLNARA